MLPHRLSALCAHLAPSHLRANDGLCANAAPAPAEPRSIGVSRTTGSATASAEDRTVFILGPCRTAMGSLGGAISTIPAPQLGAIAIKESLQRARISPEHVQAVYMGNVLSANIGQAPARQAALAGGLPHSVVCTTINKVCASGMKCVALAAQSIILGEHDVIVAGGFESMSLVPYYQPSARFGARMGHQQLVDGMIKDGLWDPYKNFHMGGAAELCASTYQFTREQLDQHAAQSYRRALDAQSNGSLAREIVPVPLTGGSRTAGKKGAAAAAAVFAQDDECKKLDVSKLSTLKPAFVTAKEAQEGKGVVTAANASKISDGAAAMVLVSGKRLKELKLQSQAVATVVACADAEKKPELFTIAPADAIKLALKRANLQLSDIDYFEINEAFSVVALANIKILGLDPERVNVYGGAVALGHPLGCSGARIIVTLCNVLEQKKGTYGCAAICNGGGGATAVIIKRFHQGQ